jgi:hypothetical protein
MIVALFAVIFLIVVLIYIIPRIGDTSGTDIAKDKANEQIDKAQATAQNGAGPSIERTVLESLSVDDVLAPQHNL